MDMAVKCPKSDYYQTQAQKENFVRECHAWMDLGLHPHIVTCHYVRVLESVPRVFADYVDGGSLKDWIKDRRLYEGGKEKALERILDVAIQFAWGLHYAHEKGLIHQDVKPDNVMLSTDGVVKVTDFGLANAQALAEEGAKPAEGQSILASFGGMTRAYCSPEQADNAARRQAGIPRDQLTKLTRRTDIYSWAVSVLEMFAGEVFWMAGNVVGEALDSFLDQRPEDDELPPMPEAVVALLKRCLQKTPEDRPQDFAACVSALREIYRSVAGTQYPTEQPAPVTELADVLNNKALSFLELDPMKYGDKAEALWQEAQVLHRNHLQVTYNFGLRLWRTGRETDVSLLTKLQECAKDASEDPQAALCLGWVQWERGELEEAEQLFEQAVSLGGSATASVWREQAFARKAESARCLRTFEGHTDVVTSVYLSWDGHWALSGSWDTKLRLWETATGCCLRIFEGHTGAVSSVCLSGDGCLALSGSDDSTLRLWDVESGSCLHTFEGHTDIVTSVSLSADAHLALSGSSDKTLQLWAVATGGCLRTFEGHTAGVTSVCLSADARWALSGSWDRMLRLWEVATGRCLRVFEGHAGAVGSVCLSADGRWALSGGGSTLRLWEVATGRCIHSVEGHSNSINSVCLSRNGCWALSGSADNTMRFWTVATGRCLRTYEDHTTYVSSVFLGRDGCRALSGGLDRKLRLWEVSFFTSGLSKEAPALLCRVVPAEKALKVEENFERQFYEARRRIESDDAAGALEACRAALSVDGHRRDSRALDLLHQMARRLKRVGLRAAWPVRSFVEVYPSRFSSVWMSADARWALSGSDKTVGLWDVSTGRCLRTFEEHSGDVTAVCLSGDGHRALSGSWDNTIRLWDTATGRCLRTFKGHTDMVNSVSLSVDGSLALSASWDNTMRLWDVGTGRCLRSFEGHTDMVNSVALSVDGRWALSGSGKHEGTVNNMVRFWEVATGRCRRIFEGHTAQVLTVCLSLDGRWVLSGSADNAVRLWEVATGRCLRTFKGHTRYVNSVCLSGDGHWVLSGSVDNTVRFWEVATGLCVHTFQAHTAAVLTVCLSGDGRWALSGSADKTLRLWEFDWEWEAVEPADWDEGARPYVENFLTQHTPYAAVLPQDREPSPDEITRALTREGRPAWTEDDFKQLLHTLGCAGYGWLRPGGVRKELEKMAATWNGPPPLIGGE